MFDLVPFGRQERNLWNRVMQDPFRVMNNFWTDTSSMCTDIEDRGDHFLLQAEMPGIAKEDIRIDIEGDRLRLQAESKQEKDDEKRNYVYRERRYYRYDRSYNIRGIDQDGIRAKLVNGVLELTLPKQTEAAPKTRSIEVQAEDESQSEES
ncbi:MAG: Hsp20/alpha crystallin family protein [Bacillota bacterium]|nr:Hsp20/alpha crystallin family protein [Bacillota bacterium]